MMVETFNYRLVSDRTKVVDISTVDPLIAEHDPLPPVHPACPTLAAAAPYRPLVVVVVIGGDGWSNVIPPSCVSSVATFRPRTGRAGGESHRHTDSIEMVI